MSNRTTAEPTTADLEARCAGFGAPARASRRMTRRPVPGPAAPTSKPASTRPSRPCCRCSTPPWRSSARRARRMTAPRISHISALYLITGVCGLVDAACFLSLGGVFAEIMTGNLLFLCFYLGAGHPIEGAGKYVLVLAAFAIGAVIGGRILQGSWQE